VAIKKVFQDPKYSNREFKIVVQLDHPNCIKVQRYFFTTNPENPDEKYLNLVMDFTPDTLYKILKFYAKKNFAFPIALGKLYAYQMFRALTYIHNLGICHRDVKPQNILIDVNTHRLVFCDFGSAKQLKPGE
jgi:serine/threonine protein kinase